MTGNHTGRSPGSDGFQPGSREGTSTTKGRLVDAQNDEYLAQLGATLVSLLRRRQAAEEEGLLVEVLELETALASLRAELAVVAERRRSTGTN